MKVLVVEDDALQRLAAVEVLSAAGYTVEDVDSADAAVSAIEAGWHARVVVTDVHMPGSMNGFELANTICERWPQIGVVIVSGVLRPKQDDLPDESRFLAKPYAPDKLTNLIEEVAACHADRGHRVKRGRWTFTEQYKASYPHPAAQAWSLPG